ncbi:MAG: hypothetical protein Q9173_006558 [Seirophora scorigena]
MYVLCVDVLGKGKGLVAIENISRGTRILSQEPIITVPRNEDSEQLRISTYQQVGALGEHQRRAFLSMHSIHAYRNAAEQYHGINRWNSNIKRHTVHALRDIREGEEITIYYLGVHKNRKARKEALQANFGFQCSCGLCSLPLEQSQESDRRLDEIYRSDNLIGRGGLIEIRRSPLRFLRNVNEQVRLYNEQRPDDAGLPRAFLDAAQIAIANGDLARRRIFAERAISGWHMANGGDSMEVIEHRILARDPSKYQLYGISMKWRTQDSWQISRTARSSLVLNSHSQARLQHV